MKSAQFLVPGGKHGKVDNLWSLHSFVASEFTTCWYNGNVGGSMGEQEGNHMEHGPLFHFVTYKVSIGLF